MVFEKLAQRKIFVPNRDEVTGSGEECIMRRAGHVVRMGDRRGTHRVLVGGS